MEKREQKIFYFIAKQGAVSVSEIFQFSFMDEGSLPTLKRVLSKLLSDNIIEITGKGKSTKYKISATYEFFQPINLDTYFEKDIDQRNGRENYNLQLLDIFENTNLFTSNELQKLDEWQNIFSENIKNFTSLELKKEFDRLAVDLSWKSSQIEGNTYTLLETERLLNEKKTASGRTKDEAIMLLNHKTALDFIIENPDYLVPLTISKIEDIHRLLVQDLDVDKNIRHRRVRITGTNYTPLDNEFQIREEMQRLCNLVNLRENVFEKSLLALLLLSYIQPFTDGNKRTARIVSNAILLSKHYCPISFRSVDSLDYKKAMLLFYEQNNLSAFKQIFIDQVQFAVNTYF
ncbi:MAG: Fic family protein [Paludibacter sp.]|nr:Fic family protein [Paludibacter sp.]